jgi:hypothetical protein
MVISTEQTILDISPNEIPISEQLKNSKQIRIETHP